MRLKVGKYEAIGSYHLCEVLDGEQRGKTLRVDVMLDGLGKLAPNEIEGREIECEFIRPFLWLAYSTSLPNVTNDVSGRSEADGR